MFTMKPTNEIRYHEYWLNKSEYILFTASGKILKLFVISILYLFDFY